MFLLFQVRYESIEAVNRMLEEANKRIQPTRTGIITVNMFLLESQLIDLFFLVFLRR